MSPVFPFDLGGDLPLDPLPQPETHNPFLGNRGGMSNGSGNGNGNNGSYLPNHPTYSPTHPGPALISPNWPITQPHPILDSHTNATHTLQPNTGQGQAIAGSTTSIPSNPSNSGGATGQPSPWTNWTDSTPKDSVGSDPTRDRGPASVGAISAAGAAGIKQESPEVGMWSGNRVGRMRTGAEVYHTVTKPL